MPSKFVFVQPSNPENNFILDPLGEEIKVIFLEKLQPILEEKSYLQNVFLIVSILIDLEGEQNEFVKPHYYTESILGKDKFKRSFNHKFSHSNINGPLKIYPILTLGARDVYPSQNPEDIKSLPLNKDARFRFWDSSIWHRYLNYNSSEFSRDLEELLNEFNRYKHQQLFETLNSYESLEFQCRKLYNSYIVGGDHGKSIRPFNFHSEREMERKADELWDKLEGSKFRWRILIIDDKVRKRLSKYSGNTLITRTKLKLLKEILSWKDHTFIKFSQRQLSHIPDLTNEEDRDLVSKSDLILLDLKFGEDIQSSYAGEDFLESLSPPKSTEDLTKITPFDRLWIFPISVFTEGFHSYKKIKGIDSFNETFYLSDGADPLSTPHLFRYRLGRILDHQRKELGPPLSKLFVKLSEESDIKETARKIYRKVLAAHNLFLKFLEIHEKRGNNHVTPRTKPNDFVSSALKYHFLCTEEVFWLHLNRLVYLLGFESIMHKKHLVNEKFALLNRMLNQRKYTLAKRELEEPFKKIQQKVDTII